MKRFWEKLQAMMTAVAFAEEGEVEAARQIMAEAEAEAAQPRGKPDPSPPSRPSPSGRLDRWGSKA